MLTGRTDLPLEIRSRRQFPDYWCELDRFRSRPEDKKDLHSVLIVGKLIWPRPTTQTVLIEDSINGRSGFAATLLIYDEHHQGQGDATFMLVNTHN
jgi:hypothetical protein